MTENCPNCGAPPPELPAWTFLVPIAIGAASFGIILAFKGRVPGKILAGGVTLLFIAYSAWLFKRLRAVMSAACSACGHRGG